MRAYILPHPPIAVPEVGGEEIHKIEATEEAFDKAAADIAEYDPETIVVISPHNIMYRDAFYIAKGSGGEGNLARFGAPKPDVYFPYDTELAEEIVGLCNEFDIPVVYSEEGAKDVDHGTFVPLYYVNREYGMPQTSPYKILRIAPSMLQDDVLYDMGYLIERAVAHIGRRAVIIASGDLSHKLKEDGPYGFIKEGPEFDRLVTDVMKSIFECENWYVRLAKKSLEKYVREGRQLEPEDTEEFPDFFTREKAGVFVCIKKAGQLRGCIGTILPSYDNTLEETCALAISAGTNDPRFSPVSAEELSELDYTVDVMGTPTPAKVSELDERRYGVIVSAGRRRGLLLPNLEGVDSVQEQIDIASRKGGIAPGEDIEIERFTVERHT